MARILIVDDNPSDRAVCRKLLGEAGHQVVAVACGADAVSVIEAVPCDLVLLDYELPGKNGGEVLQDIRALCKTPVVACTGLASPADRKYVLGKGFDELICKPVGKRDLLALCERYVGAAAPAPKAA
ncbi:MAG: response regulator [Candidatus Methylomirabilis sp.]|nr:response regulator [Deltaproteobacteria bacterium]